MVDAILEYLPNSRVRYQEHGGDPRNYRVDFQVREQLNFSPQYTVKNGVAELLSAMENQVFEHVEKNPSVYGNYKI